jgi:hypothetical protein
MFGGAPPATAVLGLLTDARGHVHHGLTLLPARSGHQGRVDGEPAAPRLPSEMAQNFWTAIWAFGACFSRLHLISV